MPGSVDIFCFQILINSSPCCSFLSLSVGLACCDLNCIRLGPSAARAPCFSKAGFVVAVWQACFFVFTVTMPSASLDFRAICGSFVFTYIGFMYRRAKFRLTMRVRILTASSRLKGVMVGWILTVFFTGDLLLMCGDVERNPGPRSDNMRQTRLNSGNRSDNTPTADPRNDSTGTET